MPVRPKSGKKKKEKPKPPKVQIKELTEQNEQLTLQLETVKNENNGLKDRLIAVNSRIVGATEEKYLLRNGVKNDTSLEYIPAEALIEFMDKLIVKRKVQDTSVEARVEDLESRITQMAFDLARITKKSYAYECGLDIIKKCSSLSEVKDKVYDLQIIAGKFTKFVII